MSFRRFFFFLIWFVGLEANAEILSIPENCLIQETSPCLLKSSENQILKSKSKMFSLAVEAESIIKILQFSSPYQFELIQGKVIVGATSKSPIQFTLNQVPFHSKTIFAKFDTEKRLQVYDAKNFILAEYESATEKQQEVVIRKSEFLAKLDMIRFLSEFYPNKKSLLSYLKSIESSWKNELKLQTKDQTIALQRSIASIEKAEQESKAQAEKEAAELKKVRRQFFYRTFFR